LADQAPDQGGGKNFLSCPQMVCPCGFSFSPGPSLPGGAGLGAISLPAVEHLVTTGLVCSKSGIKLTFRPNLGYLAACGKDWFREDDRLGDFSRSKRVKKPFWDCCGQGCGIISVYDIA